MSTFGILSLLAFLLVVGGLVLLHYGENIDLAVAKVLFVILRLMVCSQVIIAIYEFPCYVVDGIVFICMGREMLAQIMFAICGLIVLFVTGLTIPKIKWRRHITPTMPKLIALGIVMICFFTYNELFGGAYSFDSIAEFNETRERYEEYDNHFWPTKYISHYSAMEEEDRVAIYPFDMTAANGAEIFIYKGETIRVEHEDGTFELFYYPFTWRLYEGSDPISLEDADAPIVSASDAPAQEDDEASAEPDLTETEE